MRQLRLRLPIPPLLERSPELAALAILEAALSASEAALLASYAELYNGALDGFLAVPACCAQTPSSSTLVVLPPPWPPTATASSAMLAARCAIATASASDELRHQHAADRGVHACVTSRTPR